MTARAALLHAIRLNPAEDLPRLVYRQTSAVLASVEKEGVRG